MSCCIPSGSVSTSKVKRVIFHLLKSLGSTSFGFPLTKKSLFELDTDTMLLSSLQKETTRRSISGVYAMYYLELSFLKLQSKSLRAPIRNRHRLMPILVLLGYPGSRMYTGYSCLQSRRDAIKAGLSCKRSPFRNQ